MRASLTASLRRHPLLWFFALAYAINAAATSVNLITPVAALSPIWLIAIFSPTLAAYLVAAGMGGWPEVKKLLAGYARWRIGWQWYLAALSMALIPLAVAVVYIALGNPPRGLPEGMTWGAYAVIFMQGWLTGPLAEESGWRGFALPRLQGRMSALNASLLLGVLWAFWHVPQYLTGGVASGGMMPFFIFVPVTIVLTILFTWVFNNTRGSLVATTIMHFSYNFSGGHIAGLLGLVPGMVLYGASAGLVILAALVIVFAGPKYLSRRPVSDLPIEPSEAGPVAPQPALRPAAMR
jgi:membrane protease YdiL (CAAX protease family)